ncbi:MAG TPA: glycine--tRNA ligase subunit beta [Gammaproteobacteria bacterium]|jgi:glycyl-tRNA synthetase beta chain|nr:glycine--tRNA ligase subunit beta [Gammaproteobacteria bacterium]
MSAAKKKTGSGAAAPKQPATLPFLVEIGTEELPPKSLRKLALAFLEHFEAQAVAKNLLPAKTHDEVFFSPRRLALYIPALYPRQPDRSEEKLGPAVAAAYDAEGKPTKAAEGFARSCNTTVDKLARKQTDKGERLAFMLEVKGESAAALLPGMVQEALAKLPIGKRMRWGAGDAEFVRPVHWVLMLLGDKVLKSDILGMAASNKTHGHRFHHPAAIVIKKPADYRKLLEKTGKVLVEDRDGSLAGAIGKLVTQTAAKVKGKARLDAALLEEVAALVEWPVPLVGDFDRRFLALPEEVITVVLQGQQRYFPLRDTDGRLLPHFVTVSNVQSKDPKEVKRGNERVIVPRLTDAMFFWDLDKGVRLDARAEDLETMVFQKELGSYANKQKRVAALAEGIARDIGGDAVLARRAAGLAKCDLLSNLVGEFPELQGSIGMHVARENGEPPDVARAVEEHYLPRFAGDRLPETKTGQALAIADKLDTICGIFAIGQKPTGDKDPFALKRAGLGLMRIVVEGELDLVLAGLAREALAAQPVQGKASADEVYEFLLERLKAYYLEAGIRPDVFEAVRVRKPGKPLDFQRRLQAVNEFLKLPEATALAAANKRIANILRQAGSGSGSGEHGEVKPELLKLPAETKLHDEIATLRGAVASLSQAGDYSGALKRLAALRAPVDAFFDQVMVMDQDAAVKANRLALLASLSALFLQTADLSLLQVD